MSRSRPATNPISFHKHTKQYYVTRGGKRIYLGSDQEQALKKYHRLGLGLESVLQESAPPVETRIKELANRFIIAQQANWRNPETTLKCYKAWLGRFIKDHPRLKVADFTVERFATWKISLKKDTVVAIQSFFDVFSILRPIQYRNVNLYWRLSRCLDQVNM